MITVLRLGHRRVRDARISTHCGLVARAFGAEKIIYTGEKDEKLIQSIEKVNENWGSCFKVEYEKSWRKAVNNFKGTKVHLTIYGLPFEKNLEKLDNAKDLLIIVGGEKVPGGVYKSVDFNLSVTAQPHSEIAALAVFLDNYLQGKELEKDFKGRLKVKPMKEGKFVTTK